MLLHGLSAVLWGGIFFICLFSLPLLAQDDSVPSYEIVVTAKRSEEAAQTSTVSVIPRAAFEGRSTTLTELLDCEAGLRVNKMGGLGEHSTVSIRGSTAEQVKVFLDGVLVNDPSGGGVDLSKIPLANVERIEVFKGSIPARYQGNGTAGVINIVTREAGKGMVSGQVTAGSFGTVKAGGMTSNRMGPFSYMGSFDYQHSANDFEWLDDRGTTLGTRKDPTLDDTLRCMVNNDFTSIDAVIKSEMALPGRQSLRFDVDAYRYDKGYFSTHMRLPARSRALGGRAGARLGYSVERDAWSADAYARGKRTRQRMKDPDGAVYLGVKDVVSVTDEVEAGASVRVSPIAWNTVSLFGDGGLEGYREENRAVGTLASRPHVTRKSAQATISDQIFLLSDRLLLSGAWTLDGRFTHSNAVSDTMNAWHAVPLQYTRHYYQNWNAGVKAGPVRAFILKLNAGRYTRVPNFFELFGNNAYFVGNASLLPETGLNTDLALSHSRDFRNLSLTHTLSAFYNLQQDQIVFRVLAQNASKPVNMGDLRIAGLEHSARVTAGPVTLENQFAYMRSRIYAIHFDRALYLGHERSYLPNIKEAFKFKAAFLGMFEVQYDFQYRSDYYESEVNIAILPANMTHDFSLSAFFLEKSVRLSAEVKNILDEKNYDIEAFPLPGRAFYLTLRGEFHLTETQERTEP
ncbi:MAG: TonB-dependent receptor [Fibrobacterota bacterium]